MARGAFLHPFSAPAQVDWIELVRGEGALVFDRAGRDYVDGFASLWYCQIVFDAPDATAAEATSADPSDLDAGCGGFAWTLLTP